MSDIRIRPATPADATHLACFVDMASEGLVLHFWQDYRQPGQTLFEVGRARAMREEGAFSYRNAHMAEVEGVVAGTLIGYRLDDDDPNGRAAGEKEKPALPAYIQVLNELEGMAPGHWYVNVLAVYPEYRGQGIGEALLAHADSLGRGTASKGMAIIVASENGRARRLYEKVGYREKASRPILAFPGFSHSGDWVLLTRPHS